MSKDAVGLLWLLHVVVVVLLATGAQSQLRQPGTSSEVYTVGEYTAWAGSSLLNGIGIWNNTVWRGLDNSPRAVGNINFIASNQSILYLVGKFKQVNGMAANSIIQYNMQSHNFTALCGGIMGEIYGAATYQDALFIGGTFQSARTCQGGDMLVYNIAKFNLTTQQWTNIGSGLKNGIVSSVAVTSLNGTIVIYAVGTKIYSSQSPVPFIVMWNATQGLWIDMATGSNPAEQGNQYNVIAVNQRNNQVFVGGSFRTIAGVQLNHIAQWSGSKWLPLAQGVGYDPDVYDIDFTENNDVIIAGNFLVAGEMAELMNNIARWNGTHWSSLDGGVTGLIINECGDRLAFVKDIAITKDIVYISGRFSEAGTNTTFVNNVAMFNFTQNQWYTLGNDSSFQNSVLFTNALSDHDGLVVVGRYEAVFQFTDFELDKIIFAEWSKQNSTWFYLSEDPLTTFLDSGKIEAVAKNGSDLYVGGSFITAGGSIIRNIARWDGSSWYSLGEGIHSGIVHAIAVEGSYVYVGGKFNQTSQNTSLISIARWDVIAQKWNNMMGGIDGDCRYNNSVFAIATTPEAVFIGGSFLSVGGANVTQNIAKWSIAESSWESVGNGIDVEYFVRALKVVNSTLLIGGKLVVARDANTTSENIAVWDIPNGAWLPYNGVVLTSTNEDLGYINDIEVMGNSLVIAGCFDSADGTIVNNIAVGTLNGPWSSIGGVTTDENKIATVYSLGYDPSTSTLYAGGQFTSAGTGGTTVDNIAQFVNGEWTSVGVSSRWEGTVRSILVAVIQADPHSDSNSNPAYELYIVLSCVLVILVVGLVGGAFMVIRLRRRRSLYIEIPQYSSSKKLSLRDLANDDGVKQIDPDDIQLGQRLALGASGEVLKGQWKGREIALKRMAFGQSQMTEKFMDDFLYEIKIMSTLEHQNVLKFLGASFTSTGEVFLVTEFMEHGSVKDLLARTDGKVDWKLKIRLAIDAARGMQYLHSCHPPIIHRDLKNSNLLIDRKWRCKIADFGISRIKPTTTQSMTLVGTPAYMAPEVISQNRYSEKGDVYSFGVVLCELYGGKEPYSELDLFPQQVMYAVVQEGLRPTIDDSCPTALRVLITDCLSSDPVKRPDFKEIKLRLKRL